MKKLLLSGVAVLALTGVAGTASAEVNLELGGYFKGYGAFVDQDEVAGTSVRDFDFIRETEVHFGGETVLDNGLTVGAHIEVDADQNDAGGNDSFNVDESYVYFSGGWGRLNFGAEDGANYLLQVAAPSADSNIDGLRQYLQPVNYASLLGATVINGLGGGAAANTLAASTFSIDYENNSSGKADKLTYLTPVVGGFQAGFSYTPDVNSGSDFEGVNLDNTANQQGDFWEVAARYEGNLDAVGFAIGAGYTGAEEEVGNAVNDDLSQWNVGADLDFAGFGLGVVYTETNNALDDAVATTDNTETLVVGVDYKVGAFKLGASYLDQENSFGVANLDTQRYTGGVVYEYGPGLTFRGSVSFIEHENVGALGDVDATSVLLGTQVNF